MTVSTHTDTSGMLYTLYINLLIFAILIVFFEVNRFMKQIYLKRLKKKFEANNRVPPKPPRYLFGWVVAIMQVKEDEMLHMIGLDGYMMLRFIAICLKTSLFLTFWGCVVLVPVYSTASSSFNKWNKFTLANVFTGTMKSTLWVPAIFGYIFSAYFCNLLYREFRNFVKKRLYYLVHGDPDTPLQTYYTVMVERVPPNLRSATALKAFFEKLFPGDVYDVELALDLDELENLVADRAQIRNLLEKADAYNMATRTRPTVWISQEFYRDPINAAPECRATCVEKSFFDYEKVDAIQHYSRVLELLNDNIKVLQQGYIRQMHKLDALNTKKMRMKFDSRTGMVVDYVSEYTWRGVGAIKSLFSWSSADGNIYGSEHHKEGLLQADGLPDMKAAEAVMSSSLNSSESDSDKLFNSATDPSRGGRGRGRGDEGNNSISNSDRRDNRQGNGNASGNYSINANEEGEKKDHEIIGNFKSLHSLDKDGISPLPRSDSGVSEFEERKYSDSIFQLGANFMGIGVEGLAKEGIDTARIAGKGALRGVLEATRTLEMLTIGAYYKSSSTAFVTLNSRVSNSSALQMLLSHEYNRMKVTAAPNPKDIIWANVSIPHWQIKARTNISNATLLVGAIFWSSVVGFINRLSNLDTLASDWPWLSSYSGSFVYKLLNQYLAVLILLTLLALLPLVFDLIARKYECRKTESEIQNSIMARYFYYQLANVYVTITVGSLDISQQLFQILSDPRKVVDILGESLPGVSLYFANLIIVKIFSSLPIELLRLWPLVSILSVKSCMDKKKCTRRDLRTGAFADPPLLYGLIYPNLMMVLMIIVTYSCIAPLLMPFGVVFFAFAYLMYKYQLLYVYINSYQSGGYMWYAVFNRSIVALLLGSLTLIGYLGLQLRDTFFVGPFYAVIPLPFCIVYFWYYCVKKYKTYTMNLSLEVAVEIDRKSKLQSGSSRPQPHPSFTSALYRQPALAQGPLFPEPYRRMRREKSMVLARSTDCEDEDDESLEDNVEEVLGGSLESSPSIAIGVSGNVSSSGSGSGGIINGSGSSGNILHPGSALKVERQPIFEIHRPSTSYGSSVIGTGTGTGNAISAGAGVKGNNNEILRHSL